VPPKRLHLGRILLEVRVLILGRLHLGWLRQLSVAACTRSCGATAPTVRRGVLHFGTVHALSRTHRRLYVSAGNECIAVVGSIRSAVAAPCRFRELPEPTARQASSPKKTSRTSSSSSLIMLPRSPPNKPPRSRSGPPQGNPLSWKMLELPPNTLGSSTVSLLLSISSGGLPAAPHPQRLLSREGPPRCGPDVEGRTQRRTVQRSGETSSSHARTCAAARPSRPQRFGNWCSQTCCTSSYLPQGAQAQ